MTENMYSYFSRIPMVFVLLLFVLGKTFPSIGYIFWFAIVTYTYDVLVKGKCPNCEIKGSVSVIAVMLIVYGALTYFFG